MGANKSSKRPSHQAERWKAFHGGSSRNLVKPENARIDLSIWRTQVNGTLGDKKSPFLSQTETHPRTFLVGKEKTEDGSDQTTQM